MNFLSISVEKLLESLGKIPWARDILAEVTRVVGNQSEFMLISLGCISTGLVATLTFLVLQSRAVNLI
jgi:hypothetical protein